MVTHLRLIHLQKVLKKLTQAQDGLRVARDGMEVTEILAVQCPEDEITVLFVVRDKTQGSKVG